MKKYSYHVHSSPPLLLITISPSRTVRIFPHTRNQYTSFCVAFTARQTDKMLWRINKNLIPAAENTVHLVVFGRFFSSVTLLTFMSALLNCLHFSHEPRDDIYMRETV